MSTDDARDKLVSNERVKLSATYANGLAVAIFAVGGFAPFIAALLSGNAGTQNPFVVPLVMGVCWMVSVTVRREGSGKVVIGQISTLVLADEDAEMAFMMMLEERAEGEEE